MSVKIPFVPGHPVIWYAEYHPDVKELKIPICKRCDKLFKVEDYDEPICPKCKKDDSVSWDAQSGAKKVEIDSYLLEFDEDGNDTIEFKLLPLDGMINFGLLDPFTNLCYTVNLDTGICSIRNFIEDSKPFYFSPGIDYDCPQHFVKVQDLMEMQGNKIQLEHMKSSVLKGKMKISVVKHEVIAKFQMDKSNVLIDNIAVGYTYDTDKFRFKFLIRIDCNNHLPYFISSKTPLQEKQEIESSIKNNTITVM